jgi:hypothetical protein
MQDDLNQNEIAGRAAQNLPGRAPVQEGAGAATVPDFRVASAFAPVPPMGLAASPSLPGGPAAGSPAIASLPAALSEAVAARFAGALASEAAIVRLLKPDMFNVALRPDAQTEILVNLVLRDGQVQAQASFSHGDAAAWSGRWTELQQALAPQGIKLAALNSSPTQNFSSPSPASATFAQSGDQPERRQNWRNEREAAATLNNHPVPTKPGVAPRVAAIPARRGRFENWA